MTFEVLDFINDRYYINENGQIFDKKLDKYVKPFFRNYALSVNLKHAETNKYRTYKPARLVAELFVPNPKSYKNIKYLDKNPHNINKNNLVWVGTKSVTGNTNLSDKERLELRLAINDAVEKGDWTLAQALGNKLDDMDGEGTRNQPLKYSSLSLTSKIPAQFSPIVEVSDKNGNHLAYGTTSELGKMLGIHPTTIIKRYTSHDIGRDGYRMNIVALIPKTFANATIEVYKDGVKLFEGGYCLVCMVYDIHFEDLSDLLYSNDNDKILCNGLEFKMKQGQKKIPTDYSGGVTSGV